VEGAEQQAAGDDLGCARGGGGAGDAESRQIITL